ncbi:MAG: hypothetical protein KAU22_11435 [Desulfuromonadales bacterium]|nr:hypothetical protein [Desulfuromonadales bacterium]
MAFDVSLVMTWILFLALFPMAFIWLRRAWRIFIKKDHSEVALKHGERPPNPHKWAPVVGLLNLGAGSIAVVTIGGVLGGFFPYKTWSAIAGSTIWIKIFADFIISRQAHPFALGKKKDKKKDKKKHKKVNNT